MSILSSWWWGGLSLTAFMVFIYPYFLYPLVLRMLPKKACALPPREEAPNVRAALLFCAYNEEAVLEEKIANIRSIKDCFPELEVLAYSDASSDRTNELLRSADDVLIPVISEVRTGKVLGMQSLVDMTDADVLVFSDANVVIEPSQFLRLLQYFENPEVGSVAATIHYYLPEDGSTTTAKVGGLYWKLEEQIKKLESETGSTMGNHGALFARRSQGYPQLPAHLVDDMGASFAVIFDGLRCLSAPDVVAKERLVAASADEYKRKRRIACGAFSTYQFLKPGLSKMSLVDRFKFISHKTLRWWGAVPLTLSIVFAIMAGGASGYLWTSVALMVSVILVVCFLGAKGVAGVSGVYEVVRAVLGTWLGLRDAINGRTYTTWAPAKSR